MAENHSAFTFEEKKGSHIILNGAVAESHTQQYYPSRLAKVLQAVFFGEPYQLSHTSFVTVFRVEEHVMQGYPEYARDLVLYGNMQNLFAVGDDVTVTARRRGRRLVAKRVYNHSIDGAVRVQPYIPANVIRILLALALCAAASLVRGIFGVDYGAIASGITAAAAACLPVVLSGWLLWKIVKGA